MPGAHDQKTHAGKGSAKISLDYFRTPKAEGIVKAARIELNAAKKKYKPGSTKLKAAYDKFNKELSRANNAQNRVYASIDYSAEHGGPDRTPRDDSFRP